MPPFGLSAVPSPNRRGTAARAVTEALTEDVTEDVTEDGVFATADMRSADAVPERPVCRDGWPDLTALTASARPADSVAAVAEPAVAESAVAESAVALGLERNAVAPPNAITHTA